MFVNVLTKWYSYNCTVCVVGTLTNMVLIPGVLIFMYTPHHYIQVQHIINLKITYCGEEKGAKFDPKPSHNALNLLPFPSNTSSF